MPSSQRTEASAQRTMPYIAVVVLLQFAYAGSAVIAKSAIDRNMSSYIYSVYTNMFAALFLAPFAFFMERNIRPAMTRLLIMFRIMSLALLEPVADRIIYHVALKYTTATFANSMTNTLPAMTFVLAWVLRVEQVDLRELRNQMKLLGTIFIVAGASIMTLVTGSAIRFPWTKDDHGRVPDHSPQAGHPVIGTIMITAACFCCAIFFILQAKTLKTYRAGLSLTSMICAAGAVQASLVTLMAERNHLSVWSIHMNYHFLAYAYGGIVTSGVGYYVSGIITDTKGPVFLTSFNPLSMIIVALLSSFFLGEKLNAGRVGGASVIIVGIYLIVWGRSRDKPTSSSSIPTSDQCDQRVDEPSPEEPTVVAEPSLEDELEERVVAESSSGDEIVEIDE